MCQNLQEELNRVRQDLMASFREAMPTKQFTATIFLAVVSLHLIVAQVQKTRNLEERRRLLDEFTKRKSIIEKGIQLLRQTKPKTTKRVHTVERRVLS